MGDPGGVAVPPADGWQGVAVVPGEAPSWAWVLIVTAVVCWWIWPWLLTLRGEPTSGASVFSSAQKEASGRRLSRDATGASPSAELGLGAAPAAAEAGVGRLSSDLEFEVQAEFRNIFAGATELLADALAGPPAGEAYFAAVSSLKRLAEIIDRIFFAKADELERVTALREASEAFRKDFGSETMRGFLRAAGFEHQAAAGTWGFPHRDELARLRGLTVRLCLHKAAELQKLRGPGRFLHRDNSAVIPDVADARVAEMVELYRMRPHAPAGAELRPSARERNLEADIRVKLNQRRSDRGLEQLSLHEGLAAIARVFADAQRMRARRNDGDLYPTQAIAEEVRAAVARLPLPPGYSVAHLHWSSTELPRLFGLASTRGGATPGKDGDDVDSAAEIMANEAVGYWTARQGSEVLWPSASVCGVGAALDYTVNRGFGVALVVGYEGCTGKAGSSSQAAANELRRRARPQLAEPPPFTPAGRGGARITGFRDLPTAPKRG